MQTSFLLIYNLEHPNGSNAHELNTMLEQGWKFKSATPFEMPLQSNQTVMLVILEM